MLSFGKKIRALRHLREKTLREVAAFLNIAPKFLNKIEEGRVNATKTQVFQLASCLDGDENEMLATYLEDLISQTDQGKESSERVKNISYELSQLRTRQVWANIYKPSSPLDAFIEQIIYYSGNNKIHPYEREFPDGAIQLVIELDGNRRTLMPDGSHSHLSLKKAWIEGAQKQPSTYRIRQKETTLSIRFATGGFYALTEVPATEIKNTFIDAEAIFGPAILSLREQLLACREIHTIFEVVEKYFSNIISSPKEESCIIEYVINNIDTPLSRLVEKTGYSHKHVIHLFKKYTGLSPKYFQQIRRFNSTLNDILTMRYEVDWSNIVFNNGYYDQSHFIKEFNRFAGINPGDYLATGSTCSKLLHLNEIG